MLPTLPHLLSNTPMGKEWQTQTSTPSLKRGNDFPKLKSDAGLVITVQWPSPPTTGTPAPTAQLSFYCGEGRRGIISLHTQKTSRTCVHLLSYSSAPALWPSPHLSTYPFYYLNLISINFMFTKWSFYSQHPGKCTVWSQAPPTVPTVPWFWTKKEGLGDRTPGTPGIHSRVEGLRQFDFSLPASVSSFENKESKVNQSIQSGSQEAASTSPVILNQPTQHF